MIIYYKLG